MTVGHANDIMATIIAEGQGGIDNQQTQIIDSVTFIAADNSSHFFHRRVIAHNIEGTIIKTVVADSTSSIVFDLAADKPDITTRVIDATATLLTTTNTWK